MLGLTSLEIYNSIFNVTEHNINFELYTDTFDDFSSDKLKNELEEILSISDITPYHLQHETIGPRITEANKRIGLEKTSTDGYIILLLGYARSAFRDFESYLRIVVGLDEDDIRWIKKQYKSNFITYELSPGIYLIKDIAQAVYTMGDHDGTLEYEYDDNTMKTKLVLTRFGGKFGTVRFDGKSFFITSLNFSQNWDKKPTNAIHVDSPGVNTNDKILFLRKINKIQIQKTIWKRPTNY